MKSAVAAVLCLAYILGLLSTLLLSPAAPGSFYGILALGMGIVGIGAAFLINRFWSTKLRLEVWLAAALLLALAPLYFCWMVPKPTANDISNFVSATHAQTQEQVVTVGGRVMSMPRLTRNRRAQFWFKANQLDEVAGGTEPVKVGQSVTGKLYVTVPLLQATGLYPGEAIAITGSLYKPKLPTNPGSFDFQAYIAQEGAFAGLRGQKISLSNEQEGFRWGWWTIRQRIVRAQTRLLGIPEGPLVSAMVMGSSTVNFYLSANLKDEFSKIGLAHAFAASGFQVSLILATVLALTRRLSIRSQCIYTIATLFLFLGLSGLQAPVLRAVVMGIAALIGLAMQQKIRPLGSLLLAATLLLLLNPLWIRDLSFQLSFLAMMGLLITAPAIIKRLDWMPPLFASLIAVPIAALVWTLPLQLYVFKVVSPYSIVVNIISTPFITIISIVGFISAIAALIWPFAGSMIAWPLYYPTHWLIELVEFFCQLPGNSIAVGSLSILQFLALYGLIVWAWLQRWWHPRWWLAGLLAGGLVVVPVWQTQANLFRVTVLATSGQPVVSIQEPGNFALVNSGDANTARFVVLPFLQHQGINKLDWAVDVSPSSMVNGADAEVSLISGWPILLNNLPIGTLYDDSPGTGETTGKQAVVNAVKAKQGIYKPLPVGQPVKIGSTVIKLINPNGPVFQLQIQGQNWLWLGNLKPEEQNQLATAGGLSKIQVLGWNGKRLIPELLKVLQPKAAIALSTSVDPATVATLGQTKTQLYLTNRDGAIRWTPKGGFETTVEVSENNASLL